MIHSYQVRIGKVPQRLIHPGPWEGWGKLSQAETLLDTYVSYDAIEIPFPLFHVHLGHAGSRFLSDDSERGLQLPCLPPTSTIERLMYSRLLWPWLLHLVSFSLEGEKRGAGGGAGRS